MVTERDNSNLREPNGEFPSEAVDAALAASAHAAIRWLEIPGPGESLSTLLTAMAVCARVTNGALPARHPTEFLALLTRPVCEWLPTALDESLVQHDQPTDFCRDLFAEAGVDPEAEMVQAKIGESRKRFALVDGGGEQEYAAFRRYLIEHGVSRRADAQEALAMSGVRLTDLYEDIPAACRVKHSGGSVFYACPFCGWAMLSHDAELACPWPECIAQGARFLIEGDLVRALGGHPTPPALVPDDYVRLKRGPWRYTLIPGLVELRLADALAAMEGVSVQLWPGRDRFDLLVTIEGKRCWRVDVKDWSNPDALSRRLFQDDPSEEMYVVVPDRRRWQVPVLRHRLNNTRWTAMTVSELVTDIRRLIRPAKSGGRNG